MLQNPHGLRERERTNSPKLNVDLFSKQGGVTLDKEKIENVCFAYYLLKLKEKLFDLTTIFIGI